MNLENTPAFSLNDATNFINNFYGIKARADILPGERDQNFLVHTSDNKKYVLKISNSDESEAFIEAQIEVMRLLSKKMNTVPEVVLTKNNSFISQVNSVSGSRHFIYMISFLPGIELARIKDPEKALLNDIGKNMANTALALKDYDHKAIHRDFPWDLKTSAATCEKYFDLIEDKEVKNYVRKYIDLFNKKILPNISFLPHSIIHNDANDYNVLISEGTERFDFSRKVTGLIDFGDMVYSFTIADLAVAAAYTILEKPEPLYTAGEIVRGYNQIRQLSEEEISSLFYLINMRLCLSASLAAYQKSIRPDDKYLTISQKPIKNSVSSLNKIDPDFAESYFRYVCGYEPLEKSVRLKKWLSENSEKFFPVTGIRITEENACLINLSIDSPLVDGDLKKNNPETLFGKIVSLMNEAGKKYGIGRYDEPRYLYTSPLFASNDTPYGTSRSIHIGIDVFAEAGTSVYSPMDGKVYSVSYNDSELDYGHLVILEHSTDYGDLFYTLYGHMSKSVFDLKPGSEIKKGDKVGELGNAEENGGWAPHLHFQVISDLMGKDCDFPGVSLPREREIWKSYSPDPNLILNIPKSIIPDSYIKSELTLSKRKKLIGANLSLGYKDHVKIVRGWKQYLFDETGRKYIDGYNNVPHVGHCHPQIVEAANSQMSVLNTNTRYLHDNINEYAEAILETFPKPLEVCYILNSASEANELAIRLAREYTNRKDMIVLEAAYHGNTNTLIDISPYKHDGPGGKGTPAWVHKAMIADVYRGPYKKDDPDAGRKYALNVKEILERLEEEKKGVCAFIAETCPSVGGQIFFPENYLEEVYNYIRKAGGVCIADEVQTGYGRIGSHFYAFEEQKVIPDIVVLGKPIGNGHPIAAVITTGEIADSFNNGMEFFSTFGGNTVSSAVGLAVLKVLGQENLQQNSLEVGNYLLEHFRTLLDKYDIVGDVRGSGLFLGIELVRDRETLEPAGKEASYVSNLMRHKGVLIGTDGPFHNVLKIRPPMPFNKDDAEIVVDCLDSIFTSEFK